MWEEQDKFKMINAMRTNRARLINNFGLNSNKTTKI